MKTHIPNALYATAMFGALSVFYKAGAISSSGIVTVAMIGIACFFAFALARPVIALLFVPVAAPLYLIPLVLPYGTRLVSLPLHEVILLCAAAAYSIRWLIARLWPTPGAQANLTFAPNTPATVRANLVFASNPQSSISNFVPYALLLIAAILGVLVAIDRGPALREFRWLIIEPLIFFALLQLTHSARPAAYVTIAAGTIYAIIGLVQLAGLDLSPILFGFKITGGFTGSLVTDGDTIRVTSVYGHPNNLALALGRTWPLAAALLLAAIAYRSLPLPHSVSPPLPRSVSPLPLLLVSVLLILAAILATASRGALLGVAAASIVLGVGWLRQQPEHRRRRVRLPLALAGITLVAVLAVIFTQRSEGSGAVRLLLWREAIGYIARQPWGIGLDQFYAYRNPASGRSLIDPALIGNSEQFAAHPHNLILDIWLRLGALGIISFGWIIARSVWRAFPHLAEPFTLGALAALAAALVHGLLDNFYFVPDLAFTFWLLVALINATHRERPAPATS